MPCMLTDPGFMLTVVPSGYLCRDIWCSPAAVKSTCRVSRKPITPIGWCGGHMIGVVEASLDEGPAIGCWMFDSYVSMVFSSADGVAGAGGGLMFGSVLIRLLMLGLLIGYPRFLNSSHSVRLFTPYSLAAKRILSYWKCLGLDFAMTYLYRNRFPRTAPHQEPSRSSPRLVDSQIASF